jgi:serine/threonine-protein kinase
MGASVDERSDIYSLGVVLYEMLTGGVPFHAETQVGVAMKHVNEPMPDVFELRPEVSAAVAAVVDRATAKDPGERYATVADMVLDLEGTLEVEAARSGTTGEATAVLRSVRKSRRWPARPGQVSRAGLAMGIVGAALIAAALVFGGRGLDELGDDGDSNGSEIRLSADAATDFDPLGDGEEHSDEVALAVDGNPVGSAWTTETYQDGLAKDGVGLYVDAGREVEPAAMEIRFPVGGSSLEIRAAPGETDAPDDLSSWRVVAKAADVGSRERIDLEGTPTSRFYLVWITDLSEAEDGSGLRVEISDIRLLNG